MERSVAVLLFSFLPGLHRFLFGASFCTGMSALSPMPTSPLNSLSLNLPHCSFCLIWSTIRLQREVVAGVRWIVWIGVTVCGSGG